ncbi:MAG: cobyric acid synthase, partial [Candidatus Rokubacteria bacterium]|nr:cobyric acid synthase [Candidatus Rokubacteria bacterium]
MLAPCLMVQGTASGVGKSLITAALCRIFARQGHRVAPFKSQNMALNSAVTADGREIGRAQAAQAEAAGLEPTVDMNPVLLKPEGDDCSQVVVRGVPIGTLTFREYGRRRAELLPVVAESLERLRRAHDLVIIEGAGSPAEINLVEGEIVNMRIARLAGAAVLLVGDIDRGGVFAAFVGTLELLASEDRRRIGGFVVNKFRGDATLLGPGLEALHHRTGVPVLGVVPYLERGLVAAEDSLDLDAVGQGPGPHALDVTVVRLPRIANFDDFEPLGREPGVRVRFVTGAEDLAATDLIVLPGSKATVADLDWLGATGLAAAIEAAVGRGTPVLGICGGFQMLGRVLDDPHGVESPRARAAGLGLLPVTTTFAPSKTTARVRARVGAAGLFSAAAGTEIAAYEIHMGVSDGGGATSAFTVVERSGVVADHPDGAVSASGTVMGTYLHGLFADGAMRRALLEGLARRRGLTPDPRWGAPERPGARYD